MEKARFFFSELKAQWNLETVKFVVTPTYSCVIPCKGARLPGCRRGNLDV